MIVHWFTSALVLGALTLDLLAPAGLPAWLLYFVPLWGAARWYGARGGCWVTADCATLLLLGGLRQTAGFPQASELPQRALGAAVLCGTAFSVLRRREAAVTTERCNENVPHSANEEPSRGGSSGDPETSSQANHESQCRPSLADSDGRVRDQEQWAERQQWQARLRQERLRVRQFLACEEAERQRLSRHMHDGLSQWLAALCIHLHLARDLGGQKAGLALDECLSIAEQAVEQVRDLSLDLSAALRDEIGLQAALPGYLDRRAKRAGLSVSLVTSSALGPLPSELEAACFRVVQEALTNVVRHASARHVLVELRRDAEDVQVTIRDDGAGFDPQVFEARSSRSAQSGLTAMRQRVELLGGSCCIESRPGRGTTIQVRWPLGDWLADDGPLGPAMREAGKFGVDADGSGGDRSRVGPPGRQP